MKTQTAIISGKGQHLSMGVAMACHYASSINIDLVKGIARVTYIFESNGDIRDEIDIQEIENWNCEIVRIEQ